ncbi:hypothetical protein STVIR_8175 [Streptomyces viridochromogenes Tue57]|uniref:Uncharacterized protein n=1 Tax=Streptomyces viridochromogenes Tue57 TaxID=1160705 RepID=L8P6A8_STRVR|nr:hypothetical protein STVIR_8175 [Streptomyces viridochromogenes Tue57]
MLTALNEGKEAGVLFAETTRSSSTSASGVPAMVNAF